MKTSPSVTIRQIEFELEKAEHAMGMPHDTSASGSCVHAPRGAEEESCPPGLRRDGSSHRDDRPNFARLDSDRPEISRLVIAMLQARQAVIQRAWSHPQEHATDEWWADVLADPRARRTARGAPGAITIYRLRDEQRATILVSCSKCDWKAAYSRDELIAQHGADRAMPDLLNELAAPGCSNIGSNWDRCGAHFVEPIEGVR